MGLETPRRRGRQFFGGVKDFCPNFLKLARKFVSQQLLRLFLETTRKKDIHVFFGEEKVKLRRISIVRLIHHTMRAKVLKQLCPNFVRFCPGFSEVLPRFSTNQNFWGCARIPCLLHHYRNWSPDREQVSRLHHCDSGH